MDNFSKLLAKLIIASLALFPSGQGFAFELTDPVGDVGPFDPDLIAMRYEVAGDALNIKLNFAQDLCGSVVNQNVRATIGIDADRSLLTGFVGNGELVPQFGMDYEIEVTLGGFCSVEDIAFLKYWQYAVVEPDKVQLDRVSVRLDRNGAVFVRGRDDRYGTSFNEVFISVPLSFFDNEGFPIRSDECPLCTECANQILPPQLPLQDLGTANVSVFTQALYLPDKSDTLPEEGVWDGFTDKVRLDYPYPPDESGVEVIDVANDCFVGFCPSAELTKLTGFVHDDGNISLELELESLARIDNPAAFRFLFDLDDDATTGEVFSNGVATLGVDLFFEAVMFDNPIGESNPLAGTVFFWIDGGIDEDYWCTVIYTDYLSQAWWAAPGYVWVTIPDAYLTPYLRANTSGEVKIAAYSFYPTPGGVADEPQDIVPNNGALSLQISRLSVAARNHKRPDSQ